MPIAETLLIEVCPFHPRRVMDGKLLGSSLLLDPRYVHRPASARDSMHSHQTVVTDMANGCKTQPTWWED